MKNGDILELKIIRQDNFGKGIAKYNDFVIFVPNSLIDELVKVEIVDIKKKYANSKLVEIILSSKNRVDAPCKYYNLCGGCNILHMDYNYQIEYKLNRLKDTLKIDNIDVISSNQFNYRNKIVLRVKNNKVGLYEELTNSVVNIEECLISNKKINELINRFNKFNYINKIETITIRALDKTMISIVGDVKEKYLIDSFKDIDSIYLNNILIHGQDYIDINVLDINYRVSNESFFQVNIEMMKKLYETIKRYANFNENDSLLDLYSGVGTISLYLSKYVKNVTGIEVIKEAVDISNINKKLNNIHNVEFICNKVENVINSIDVCDVVVVDPPRKGLDNKVIDKLLELKPKNIIYVSCNPDTLIRDIKLLNNYKINKCTLVDMFPNTYHVETVVLMSRVDK